MEFDDFCIKKSQVIGCPVAALKDIRYIVKLWKARSDFMESVKQLIITIKVVARDLFFINITSHYW